MDENKILEIIIKAKDEATAAIQKVQKSIEDSGKASETASNHINNLFNVMKAAFTMYAGKKLFDFTIGNAAQFEQYETSFKVMLGSADAAKAKLKELSDYANSTPFELPEVVEASRVMMAFGLDTKKYLADVGNLAAGTGKPIQQVADAFARLQSGQFGEAFQQMAQLGISRQMLMGEGLQFDKNGSYKGSVEQALAAVQKIVKTKFAGMTEEQSQTFNGLVSTFQDSLSAFGREIGIKAFPAAKAALKDLMASFDALGKSGALDAIGTAVGKAMSLIANAISLVVKGIASLATFISANWNVVQPILLALGAIVAKAAIVGAVTKLGGVLKTLGTTLSGMLSPVNLIIIAFGLLYAAYQNNFMGFGTFVDGIIAKAMPFFNQLIGYINQVVQYVVANWPTIQATISQVMTAIGSFITTYVVPILEALRAKAQEVIAFVVAHWPEIQKAIQQVSDFIGNIINNFIIPAFKLLADGIALVIQFISDHWTQFVDFFKNVWNTITSDVVAAWNYISPTILGAVKAIVDFVTATFPQIWQIVEFVFNKIVEFLTPILAAIGIVVVAGIGFIVGFMSNAWNLVKDTVKYIWDAIRDIIKLAFDVITGIIRIALDLLTGNWSRAWKDLKTLCSNFVDDIVNYITHAFSNAWQWGADLVKGIGRGITSALSYVTSAVKNVAGAIWNNLHFSRPEEGPLRNYEQWMPDFMGGLAKGIDDSKYKVTDAIKSVTGDLSVNTNLSANTSAQSTSKPVGAVTLHIEHFHNNTDKDIETLAYELEAYRKKAHVALGGAY